MPATPSDSTITPTPNLATAPAAVVCQVIFHAAYFEFPKPKQRARFIAAMREALAALEARGSTLRIRERDSLACAQARVDAAKTLRLLLAGREA